MIVYYVLATDGDKSTVQKISITDGAVSAVAIAQIEHPEITLKSTAYYTEDFTEVTGGIIDGKKLTTVDGVTFTLTKTTKGGRYTATRHESNW